MAVMTFEETIESIMAQAGALLDDPQQAAQCGMPGRAYFLDDNQVLALPRDNGDSRYPYGQDGFNFWVYASGYMHGNEGLFSHFLRAAEGQEPHIAFFAGLPRDDNQAAYSVVPLMPVPAYPHDEAAVGVQRYTVLGSCTAYFVTLLPTLRVVLRVFVTPEKAVCFSWRAQSLTDQHQRFYVSSFFNPFLRNQISKTSEDRWFKAARLLDATADPNELGGFQFQVNEDKDRLHSVTHYGVLRRCLHTDSASRLTAQEATTSRYQYVGGVRSSLHTAASLAQGTFGPEPQRVCTFVETAIAGDLLHLEVSPRGWARADMVFNHTDDPAAADRWCTQPPVRADLDARLAKLQQDDTRRHSGLTLSIDETDGPIKQRVFNAFLEHLKRQVEFCSLIKGYIQLSPNSLIGIRDVFQALWALMFWRPEAARAKMLEALSYTAPDGRCFRQYSLPTSTGRIGRMDLRPFIDQGVWVISCISTYVKLTGDMAFLDEVCGYHEIVDEAAGVVRPSPQRDTVLQHLLKILGYMLDHRDHDQTGCVRALYGDWNDALDGLGISQDPNKAYGSGVSVMATLQVYRNCNEMAELLTALDSKQYWARIREYKDAAKEIKEGLYEHAIVQNEQGQKRIVHGWGDNRSYLVGGFDDPDGQARDGLTSNAYWVLTGLLAQDPAMEQHLLDAFDRLDGKYGFKTFEPYFAKDAPGVGRIRKLPAGTAENGAAYIHATAFAIKALFQMGHPKRAWDQLVKILPFTPGHDNLSHSPFVMPNSYGYNPQELIDGQNMNDWQTGSSNVVLRVLILYVFGFEPQLDGLWVQPASWAPFRSSQFVTRCRGCEVRITFEDRGEAKRRFTVNGQEAQPTHDPIMKLDRLWVPYDQFNTDRLEIGVYQ